MPTLTLRGHSSVDSLVEPVADVPARPGLAKVWFEATGTALATVTIGGVVFTEADPAVPANGVYTNGASDNDTATSLAAAINGDTRAASRDRFDAAVTASGGGVLVGYIASGALTAAERAVTTTDPLADVTAFTDDLDVANYEQVSGTYTVTAGDVNLAEVNIPLPVGWLAAGTSVMVAIASATGLRRLYTSLVTVQITPPRIRIDADGATNAVATDVVHYIAVRRR